MPDARPGKKEKKNAENAMQETQYPNATIVWQKIQVNGQCFLFDQHKIRLM